MSRVLTSAIVISLVIFLAVAIVGYVNFADDMYDINCPRNILLSYKYKGFPVVTIVALLTTGFTIIFATPLSIKPSKDALRDLLFMDYKNPEENMGVINANNGEKKPLDSTKSHFILVTIVVYS